MYKHVFQDREMPQFELMPEGDYQFEVISVDQTFSQGAKTKGCTQFELTLDLGKGTTNDTLILPEYDESGKLVAPTDPKALKFLDGKLDCFLKCTGAASQKGDAFEFCETALIGLRGWLRLFIDEFKKNDGSIGKSNKVKLYYTNKEKLPRNKPQHVMPTAADDFN